MKKKLLLFLFAVFVFMFGAVFALEVERRIFHGTEPTPTPIVILREF